MRIIPFIVALLVGGFLYLIVFERDRLLGFSQGQSISETRSVDADVQTTPPVIADQSKADTGQSVVSVVAMRSSAQTINGGVLLRGRTEASRRVNVLAETSGKVISAPIRKGTTISAGQILCQLDPGTREVSLKRALAALSEAKSRIPEAKSRLLGANASLHEAKINDNAARKLKEGGYASDTRVAQAQAVLETAKAGIESAKAGVQSAEAAVEAALAQVAATKKDIEHLVLKAPFGGILEQDTAELGTLLQPGAPCATILQLDPIHLVGFAPETEIGRISLGARVGARLATGQKIDGKISFLSRSADERTRTFRVEAQIPNSDSLIRDGQTAEILIAAAGDRAHLLPQSALTLNNEGTLGVRIVNEGNIVGFAPVTILRDVVEGVWVSGLPDQVSVIVTGQEYVIAGVDVDVTYQEAAQ